MSTVDQSNKLAIEICNGNYRYLYGGKDQPYTSTLVSQLASRYPSVFKTSIKTAAYADADKGYIAIDCSGFVCKVLSIGVSCMGSSQLRQTAVKRLKVLKSNAKPGMVLWRNGHVAYVGKDLNIYEAQSTKNDMKVSTWEKRASSFKELLIVKGSALANENINSIIDNKNPYTKPVVYVCSKSIAQKKKLKNYLCKDTSATSSVKWVQYELREAGCKGKNGKDLTIDGDFGTNSDYALVQFQLSSKLSADHICGTNTIKALERD